MAISKPRNLCYKQSNYGMQMYITHDMANAHVSSTFSIRCKKLLHN